MSSTKIKESDNHGTPTYSQEGKLISWNPKIGLAIRETEYFISPAELLNHEGAHALRDNTDRIGINRDYDVNDENYKNLEEKRVIENVESITAYRLGRLKKGEKTRISIYGFIEIVPNVKFNRQVIDEGAVCTGIK